MEDQYARTKLLIGAEALERLRASRVAIFGIGGVGGYVCEALARSGIGTLDIIDSDTVAYSNLNRQIIATHDTIGRYKVDVMQERIGSIDPDTQVNVYKCFFLPETADDFPFSEYDYVVDAVDTVTAKLELIMRCQSMGIPIISSMGAANKLDPGRLRIADIYETRICPLARVMRRELKKRKVEHLKVVYSDEPPCVPLDPETAGVEPSEAVPPAGSSRRSIPGSTAFVPSAAGLLIAAEVAKDLIAAHDRRH